jgi:hypothetical protein
MAPTKASGEVLPQTPAPVAIPQRALSLHLPDGMLHGSHQPFVQDMNSNTRRYVEMPVLSQFACSMQQTKTAANPWWAHASCELEEGIHLPDTNACPVVAGCFCTEAGGICIERTEPVPPTAAMISDCNIMRPHNRAEVEGVRKHLFQ